MSILKELNNMVTEAETKSSVSKDAASKVYHRDYVKTKRKKYRRYTPSEHKQS